MILPQTAFYFRLPLTFVSLFAKLMSVQNPKFFPEILKSGNPLDFSGLFHRANSFDHLITIEFQRISAKKLLKFSGLARTYFFLFILSGLCSFDDTLGGDCRRAS